MDSDHESLRGRLTSITTKCVELCLKANLPVLYKHIYFLSVPLVFLCLSPITFFQRYVFLALIYYYTFDIQWAEELRWEWIAYGTFVQSTKDVCIRINMSYIYLSS